MKLPNHRRNHWPHDGSYFTCLDWHCFAAGGKRTRGRGVRFHCYRRAGSVSVPGLREGKEMLRSVVFIVLSLVACQFVLMKQVGASQGPGVGAAPSPCFVSYHRASQDLTGSRSGGWRPKVTLLSLLYVRQELAHAGSAVLSRTDYRAAILEIGRAATLLDSTVSPTAAKSIHAVDLCSDGKVSDRVLVSLVQLTFADITLDSHRSKISAIRKAGAHIDAAYIAVHRLLR
jgi:hypothetical protein